MAADTKSPVFHVGDFWTNASDLNAAEVKETGYKKIYSDLSTPHMKNPTSEVGESASLNLMNTDNFDGISINIYRENGKDPSCLSINNYGIMKDSKNNNLNGMTSAIIEAIKYIYNDEFVTPEERAKLIHLSHIILKDTSGDFTPQKVKEITDTAKAITASPASGTSLIKPAVFPYLHAVDSKMPDIYEMAQPYKQKPVTGKAIQR